MKGFLSIDLPALFIFVLLVSCVEDQKKVPQWTKNEVYKFTDSLEFTQLIAGYNDGEGVSMLIENDSAKNGTMKITRSPGYADIVDTLVMTDVHNYKSLKDRTTYSVNDSEVVMTVLQKIIHPSSNWQGQTPWQETIVSKYQRLDLNLNTDIKKQ